MDRLKMLGIIGKRPEDVVGVDISEDQVTIAVLKAEPGFGVKDFMIKNISREASDDELYRVIAGAFTEKGLPGKEVWLNIDIPEPKVHFRRASLPVMPLGEIGNAVKWNLKDRISLDVANYNCAYEVIDEFQKADGSKNLNIMAVLIEKAVISRFIGIFKRAGIALAGISTTPFSLANALNMIEGMPSKTDPVLICHIGIEYSYICICAKGKLDFVRQIPLAMEGFLSSMKGVLVSEKGRLELTAEDARMIIEKFGIPKETDVILEGKVAAAQVIAMTRPVVERFVSELSRSVDYYQKELRTQQRIAKVFLTGEGSDIKNLDEIISKGLNVGVERLKAPEGLNCAVAIGTAAGRAGKINLLPEELINTRQEEIKKGALRVATTAVLSLLFLSFLTTSVQIASYKKEIGLIHAQKLILKDFKEMQDRINHGNALVSSVRGAESPVDLVFKELSNITPGNIAFVEIFLNQPQKVLKLRGKISEKPDTVQNVLSNFMEELEKSPFTKEANLVSVQKDSSATGDISSFQIDCVMER